MKWCWQGHCAREEVKQVSEKGVKRVKSYFWQGGKEVEASWQGHCGRGKGVKWAVTSL